MYLNGIVVQDSTKLNKVMKNVSDNYRGIHRFYDDPLIDIKNNECRALQDERMFNTNTDNLEICNQFISNIDLAKRYIGMCNLLRLDIRILFITSNYPYEIWNENEPKCDFLGYEVSEIPFGVMTIYDLYTNEKFENFKAKLNENGLFSNAADANEFLTAYKEQLSKGLVGDGDVDLYVCCVYEVIVNL